MQKTVAIAESCTGGLISHKITNVAGSSAYFELGVITYSNKSKEKLLKVPHWILAKFGAVSKETALAMAEGVRKLASSDIGLSVTGIAGPSGATKTKPIGLVFIGLAYKNHKKAKKYIFKGDRKTIKEQASQAALKLLHKYLKNNEFSCN